MHEPFGSSGLIELAQNTVSYLWDINDEQAKLKNKPQIMNHHALCWLCKYHANKKVKVTSTNLLSHCYDRLILYQGDFLSL